MLFIFYCLESTLTFYFFQSTKKINLFPVSSPYDNHLRCGSARGHCPLCNRSRGRGSRVCRSTRCVFKKTTLLFENLCFVSTRNDYVFPCVRFDSRTILFEILHEKWTDFLGSSMFLLSIWGVWTCPDQFSIHCFFASPAPITNCMVFFCSCIVNDQWTDQYIISSCILNSVGCIVAGTLRLQALLILPIFQISLSSHRTTCMSLTRRNRYWKRSIRALRTLSDWYQRTPISMKGTPVVVSWFNMEVTVL